MKDTRKKMAELLELRNKEQADFKKALKADAEAVVVLNRAIVALTGFYKKNGISMTLIQRGSPDKAPELAWESQGDAYKGHNEENHGIVQILAMLVEDYTLEMRKGRTDDAKAQDEFEADRQAMNDMFRTQKESYVGAEQELAEVEAAQQEAKGTFDQAKSDASDQDKLKKTLGTDCGWIKKKFGDRRKQRATELDGLAEAKNLLAAAQRGSFDELMLIER